MFKDERRGKVWDEIRQYDLRSFDSELTTEVFAEAAERAGLSIRANALNYVNLVWMGISCAMHATLNFAQVLTNTLKLLEDQQDFYSNSIGKAKKNGERREKRGKKGKRAKKSKHDPRREDPTEVSEEAFTQARQRMPLKFWVFLIMVLAEKFEQQHGQHLYVRGFRLLALDGSTLTLQNWKPLRDYYGTAKNGKRKKKGCVTQARMVMLTFPTVRLPLAYEVTPLSDAEQTVAARLLGNVRAKDLVLMDRGFFSYGLFWQIQKRGGFFATRLKKGVKFKSLSKLGRQDQKVEWTPKDSRGKWKKQGLPRSIELRVIRYQIKGFRPSQIVTNVLNPKRLSREDFVRLATDCDKKGKLKPGLYHRRWEIETTFFELKVTMQMKTSLRSRRPASLEYEIAGHVVYYLLLRWLIVQAAEKHGLDPLRLSFSGAMQELEQMRPSLITNNVHWVNRVLLPRLLDRIAQHVVPRRPGRHYTRPNDTKAKNRGNGQTQQPAKLKANTTKKRPKSNNKNKQRKAA